MATDRLGPVPIQTRAHKVPKRTRRSILPYISKGCFMAVRSLGIFSRRMRWFHSGEISDSLTRLSSAPVWRRHRNMCMIWKETWWDRWHLYVGLSQITISFVVAVEGSSSLMYIVDGGIRPIDEGPAGLATGENGKCASLWTKCALMRVQGDRCLPFLWGSVSMRRR